MTAEERSESNARHRRHTQNRPARYVNGVRLSDDEVANITIHKSKKVQKSKNEAFLESSRSSSALSIMRVAKLQAQASARERNDPEHPDGLMIKNFVMG